MPGKNVTSIELLSFPGHLVEARIYRQDMTHVGCQKLVWSASRDQQKIKAIASAVHRDVIRDPQFSRLRPFLAGHVGWVWWRIA